MTDKPLPVDVDATDVAIAMIAEALPGFEALLVPARDAVGIRGALPIATTVTREAIFYPIYRDVFVSHDARPFFDALETDASRAARHERQREAIKRELEPLISKIVGDIRRYGIGALGLGPVMEERERRAHGLGYSEGYAGGFAAGKRQALVDALAALEEATEGNDE